MTGTKKQWFYGVQGCKANIDYLKGPFDSFEALVRELNFDVDFDDGASVDVFTSVLESVKCCFCSVHGAGAHALETIASFAEDRGARVRYDTFYSQELQFEIGTALADVLDSVLTRHDLLPWGPPRKVQELVVDHSVVKG